MHNDLVPVKENVNFLQDVNNRSLLLSNTGELDQFIRRKQMSKEIDSLKNQIHLLNKDLDDIKTLLTQLISKTNE